jgi:23S rRNA (adenine2503-C2)-methyltransferase
MGGYASACGLATYAMTSASLPTGPARLDIAGLELPALEARLAELGAPRYHAKQIFAWVHRRGVTDFAAMTDLPKGLRARLGELWTVGTPALVRKDVSTDGTTKYLFELADRTRIESVFIPDTPSQTFCISSQVGCAMACAFCLTGRMGLTRHLTAGEIEGQVRVLAHDQGLAGPDTAFNIVVMGMGEPLHNYDATMAALRIVGDPNGLAVPARRITLSTVGVVPGIEKLGREPFMPNLAISLHATHEDQRDALVPINRKYDLEALIEACRRFPVKRRGRITFEYVLLKGVNDTPEDARRLVKLLDGIRGKVNLLPLNAAPGIPFERPDDARVDAFAAILAEKGLTVSVRKSRGRDIRAACGQLIVDEGVRGARAAQSAAQALADRL